jgi:hypothetical protein
MNVNPENQDFVRLIVALEPWLEQIVIIGGWAHLAGGRRHPRQARNALSQTTPRMNTDQHGSVICFHP